MADLNLENPNSDHTLNQVLLTKQGVPVVGHDHKALALALTTTGTLSEITMSLLGLCVAFGIDNAMDEFNTAFNQGDTGRCILLLFTALIALCAGVQSFCLEYPFAKDLIANPDAFFKSYESPAPPLTYKAIAGLLLVIIIGALTRATVSIDGYYKALGVSILTTVASIIFTLVDTFQVIASDGSYLKDNWLWCMSDRSNPLVQASLSKQSNTIDKATKPLLQTGGSQCIFALAWLTASLAILGDVGLALLAFEDIAEKNHYDAQHDAGKFIKCVAFICYSILTSSIDSPTWANTLTFLYENYVAGTPAYRRLDTNDTSRPSACATLAVEGLCLTGAFGRAVGTYSGWFFLLQKYVGTDKNSYSALVGMIVFSAAMASIRAGECLLVERVATLNFLLPCQGTERAVGATTHKLATNQPSMLGNIMTSPTSSPTSIPNNV